MPADPEETLPCSKTLLRLRNMSSGAHGLLSRQASCMLAIAAALRRRMRGAEAGK